MSIMRWWIWFWSCLSDFFGLWLLPPFIPATGCRKSNILNTIWWNNRVIFASQVRLRIVVAHIFVIARLLLRNSAFHDCPPPIIRRHEIVTGLLLSSLLLTFFLYIFVGRHPIWSILKTNGRDFDDSQVNKKDYGAPFNLSGMIFQFPRCLIRMVDFCCPFFLPPFWS